MGDRHGIARVTIQPGHIHHGVGQARRADHRRLHPAHQDVLTPLPQESPQAPIPVDKRAVRRTGVDHRYVGVPPQQRVAVADPFALVQAA